jgi:hypothetical protein
MGTRGQRAEHAPAADRFAREIVGFLTVIVVRLRRLMGKPLGGDHQTPGRRCSITWYNASGEDAEGLHSVHAIPMEQSSMIHPTHPPSDPQQFFPWLKVASEQVWVQALIHHHIYGFQIQPGTCWLPGLTEHEIGHYEAELGFAFPTIYKLFLKQMNGTDKFAVNVYGESGTPYAYAPAYYSYPRDIAIVRDYIDWVYKEFDITPEDVDQQQIPHILPITGHRFLVMDRGETHAVLSMYGRDTIIYAPSLQAFLVNDIFDNHSFEVPDSAINVRFWLEDEDNEP